MILPVQHIPLNGLNMRIMNYIPEFSFDGHPDKTLLLDSEECQFKTHKYIKYYQGRSSHWRCSIKKDVFYKKFAKFTGKHLCPSLFLNKVGCLRPAALSKKGLRRRCFPVTFVKFIKYLFYKTLPEDCFCKCSGDNRV